MIQSNKGYEKDKRRFDIGSGQSLELLDTVSIDLILNNNFVRPRILGLLGSLTQEEGSLIGIVWNEHGIGQKLETHEVVFIGASSADKNSIYNLVKEYGNIGPLVEGISPDDKDLGVTYEFISSQLDRLTKEIRSRLTLATAVGYESSAKLVDDLVDKGNVRMMTLGTKGTNQKKVLAFPYTVGAPQIELAPGHKRNAPKDMVEQAATKKYKGPTADSQRAYDFFLGQ